MILFVAYWIEIYFVCGFCFWKGSLQDAACRRTTSPRTALTFLPLICNGNRSKKKEKENRTNVPLKSNFSMCFLLVLIACYWQNTTSLQIFRITGVYEQQNLYAISIKRRVHEIMFFIFFFHNRLRQQSRLLFCEHWLGCCLIGVSWKNSLFSELLHIIFFMKWKLAHRMSGERERWSIHAQITIQYKTETIITLRIWLW